MLQSEAGYIDARPHVRQIDETLLQRTAGPYVGVKTGGYRTATWPSASPRLTDITDSRVLPMLPVAEPLGRYATATLACSKGSGCSLDIVAWLTP